MATEIKVPNLGESVTEATVARWLKRPGETVARDEPLAELETDKATLELPAPAAGVLSEILAPEGAEVPIGAVLGRIAEGAAPAAPEAPHPAAPEARVPTSPRLRGEGRGEGRQATEADLLARSGPAVRKLVADSGLDIAAIPPSGPGGRVSKADVLTALARPEPAPAPAAEAPIEAPPVEKPPAEREVRVRMTRL